MDLARMLLHWGILIIIFWFTEFNSQHYASMLTLNVTLKGIKIYLGYQHIIKSYSVFKFYWQITDINFIFISLSKLKTNNYFLNVTINILFNFLTIVNSNLIYWLDFQVFNKIILWFIYSINFWYKYFWLITVVDTKLWPPKVNHINWRWIYIHDQIILNSTHYNF